MLRVTALPSSYGSHRAREHPRHGWEGGGLSLLPVGQGGCGYRFRFGTQIRTGRESERGVPWAGGRRPLPGSAGAGGPGRRGRLVPGGGGRGAARPGGAHCMATVRGCRSARPPSLPSALLWAAAPPGEGGGSREPPTPPLLRLSWVICPSPTHCIRKGKNYIHSIRGIWKHDAGSREITARAITSADGGRGQAGGQREQLWSGQPCPRLPLAAASPGLGWWWGLRRRKVNRDHFPETRVREQS